MGEITLSQAAAVQGAELFLGVAAALSAAELLALRHHFAGRGLLNWRILGSKPLLAQVAPLRAVAAALFGAGGFTLLLAVRLFAGVALVACSLVAPTHAFWALVVVGATSCLLIARTPLGRDGSDQMVMITSVALCCGHPVIATTATTDAALYFIGAQSVLAYGTAGVCKLWGPLWRGGNAVGAILATRTFDSSGLGGRVQEHPILNRGATWATIGVECIVPVALVAGPAPFVAALGLALVFHVVTAVAMGLNTFVPAFLITYLPAIYLAIGIHALV